MNTKMVISEGERERQRKREKEIEERKKVIVSFCIADGNFAKRATRQEKNP